MNLVKIFRVLISVSDKTELISIAQKLKNLDCEIISTGGTSKLLSDNGIEFTKIQKVTGNPEAFQGRLKTISFQVESALLYDRDSDSQEARKLGIEPIDMVICNLYPFEEMSKKQLELPELMEYIDIGGPTMIRAAAKNFKWVTVITDPQDYHALSEELDKYDGSVSEEFRLKMMRKAFNHTADYDSVIATTLDQKFGEKSIRLAFDQGKELRYGENSHQNAVFYRKRKSASSLADLKCLHGKKLSYNNMIDIEAAISSVKDCRQKTVAIIKHSNSCGFAQGNDQLQVMKEAWFGDPVSAFGSIIAFNDILELNTAKFLHIDDIDKSKRKFIEVIAAPDFEEGVIEYLSFHKNLRIIQFDPQMLTPNILFRFLNGALLSQSCDDKLYKELRIVTKGSDFVYLDKEIAEFGIKAVRNIKSNAIVIVQKTNKEILRLTGMGAGQPNRLISTKLALDKTKQNLIKEAKEIGENDPESYYQNQIKKCILVSDAYFPFADNIELASESGINCIIQPGGSIRDKRIIRKAEELGLTIIFTGIRHFRH